MTNAINLRAIIVELLQQVESRTNVDCFGLMEGEERAKEKEPIMSRILKNIAALALMVGALIGSAGTSDAQYYRNHNNPNGPGPAYYGAYRSHRAMAPMPSQRGYYTNSLTYSNGDQRCFQSPASLEYTGGCY
jgi:hypothetical protein